MLPPMVQDWCDGGRFLDTSAGRVFVRSAAGDGPTVLLLHGFPSSSFDYRAVVPALAGRAWVTLDFLGFGLSDKPRRRNSLLEQADLVQEVLERTVEGRPGSCPTVTMVAHDMGTSVATELLARDIEGRLPFDLRSAVLTNGSVSRGPACAPRRRCCADRWGRCCPG